MYGVDGARQVKTVRVGTNDLPVSVPLSEVYRHALASLDPNVQDAWAKQQALKLAEEFERATYADLGMTHEVLSNLPDGTVVKFSGGVVRQPN